MLKTKDVENPIESNPTLRLLRRTMRFNTLENWLTWLESFHPKQIDLGLKRVKDVYRSLAPFDIKPLTITVAGTNGKGSSVAMLSSIFRAEGYRVGAYTSPHLLNYNERIRINDKATDAFYF